VTYDYQLFMIEKGDRILVASYFAQNDPPTIGTVMDIAMFKEEGRFPNRVRVLSVDVPTEPWSSEVRPVKVNLLVEPD
jgi:hypothetical protein